MAVGINFFPLFSLNIKLCIFCPPSTGATWVSALTCFLAIFDPWLMELVPFLSQDHHGSLGCHLDFGSFCRTGGQFSAIWSLLQPWCCHLESTEPWCLRQACARSGILRCNCWFPLPNWTTPLDCIVRWVPQDARKQNKVFGDFGVPTSLCCVPWKCAWYVGYCQ